MNTVRQPRLYALCCALAALTFAGAAAAQTYPDKPVKIISPFSAGGPADFYARYMGQRLEKQLGQPFVIENRVGGGGIIGADAVAKSAPDGYTLLVMSNTQTVNESLRANKPYKLMTDLVPVAPLNYSDLLLVVHPSVPAKNLQELIALAKANPGKLNYASSGPGTPYHMAGELFKSMAGLDIVHVPHKESSGARTAVMGGQVEMMFDAITAMSKLAEAGKVRAIASSGQHTLGRHARDPDSVGSGRPGLRRGDLARDHGAGRHAQADRRPAERRDPEGPRAARREGRFREAGRGADADDGGRVREVPRPGHREVGQGSEGVGR